MAATPRWMGALPHALSLARVALVGLTYVAALRRDEPMFTLLALLAVLTDILDGPLARHFGTANRFGANVDSAADLLFYISLPVWVYLFNPALIVSQLPLIVVFGTLYVLANVLSHRTFGALGVHNRLSRASGTLGVFAAFVAILWGLHPVLYVALIATLAADLAQRYGNLLRAHRERQAQGA